jgi:glycosyltransferase involved in cell wall biosynthesis
MEHLGTAMRPVSRLIGIEPEAFPPSTLWALTGQPAIHRAVVRLQPDVVWATCPPPAALFAAVGALRRRSTPLVAELRDLWAGNPYFDAGGATLARIERRMLSRADAVVSVTEGCRDRLLALHPEVAPKFELLPNGFDPFLLDLRGDATARRSPRFTLVHAGTLYGDRSVVKLLRALSRPELRRRVRLELVGPIDGASGAAIAALDGTPEVHLTPPVSWRQAIEHTRAADIAVVINSPGTGGDMALPSKLFEALALGKPILALTSPGSDTEGLLRALGQDAGCAPPGDEDAIARAVARLIEEPPEPVPPERLAHWDRTVVAQRAAIMLDGLVARAAIS